jgi:hypothetical protein
MTSKCHLTFGFLVKKLAAFGKALGFAGALSSLPESGFGMITVIGVSQLVGVAGTMAIGMLPYGIRV